MLSESPGAPAEPVRRALEAAGFRLSYTLPGEGGRRLLLRPEAPGRRWLLHTTGPYGPPPAPPHPAVLPVEPLCTFGQSRVGVIGLGHGRVLAGLPGPVPGGLPEALWRAWAELDEQAGFLSAENLVWGPEGLKVLPSSGDHGSAMRSVRLADARARLETVHPHPTWAGISSAGAVRALNEDTWRVRVDGEQQLAVVVDGLGGFGAGELAAMAVADAFTSVPAGPARARLAAGVAAAQAWFGAYRGPQVGFGACLAAAVLEGRRLTVGWLGDVCVWRHGPGGLVPLHEPHLLVTEMVRAGKLSPEEARGHRLGAIVLRCVGLDVPAPELEVVEVELGPADQVLLASDGLWRALGPEDVERVLKKARGPRDGVVRLHGAALEAGAPDNVTALLLGPYS